MPHSAVSDLDLHCLSMSLLWDDRHKWVMLNIKTVKTPREPETQLTFLFLYFSSGSHVSLFSGK